MDAWLGSGVVAVGGEDKVHMCTALVAALCLSDSKYVGVSIGWRTEAKCSRHQGCSGFWLTAHV